MTQSKNIEQLEHSIDKLRRTNALLGGGLAFCVLLSFFCLFKIHGPIETRSILLTDAEDSRVAKLTVDGLTFHNRNGEIVTSLSRDSILLGDHSQTETFRVTTGLDHAELVLGKPEEGVTLRVTNFETHLALQTGPESRGEITLAAEKAGSRLYMSDPSGDKTAWMMAMKEGASASLTSKGEATWKAP